MLLDLKRWSRKINWNQALYRFQDGTSYNLVFERKIKGAYENVLSFGNGCLNFSADFTVRKLKVVTCVASVVHQGEKSVIGNIQELKKKKDLITALYRVLNKRHCTYLFKGKLLNKKDNIKRCTLLKRKRYFGGFDKYEAL